MSPAAGAPARPDATAAGAGVGAHEAWPEPEEHPLVSRPPLLDRVPVVRDLDTPTLVHRLRQVVWVLAVLAVLGWILLGANRPADPAVRDLFGTMRINVVSPAGSKLPSELCVQTAEVMPARFQGLSDRDSLDGYNGMIFVYDEDVQNQFTMRNTRIPLSIAFFDAEGRFVSAKDMAPCQSDGFCPTYQSDGPYRYALEVPQGQLGAMGIAPGSVLELGERGCKPQA